MTPQQEQQELNEIFNGTFNPETATPENVFNRLIVAIPLRILAFHAAMNDKKVGSLAKPIYTDEKKLYNALMTAYPELIDYLRSHAPEKYQEFVDFIHFSIKGREELVERLNNLGENNPVKISPKKVSRAVQTIDKISNTLFDTDKNGIFYERANEEDKERDNEAVDVIVGRKKGKDITTAVSIDFSKLDDVQFSNDYMLDPFAQAVHNAMLSMYLAGNKGGSIAQLYRVMFGNKDTLHPDEIRLQEVKRAVEKLRHTDATITITDEAKLYPFKRAVIKNYVMPVKMVEVSINGEKADGFIFLDQPPLYEYASQKNQVNTLDIQNFNVPLNAGKDTAVLLDYLNERLAGIKNKKSKMSDIILYDTLYSRLQLDAPTEGARRKKEYDVRKKVKAILDSWQKEGIISGYEEELEKPSNRIRSLRIFP